MDNRHDVEEFLRMARAGSMDALGQALEACRTYLTIVAERELDASLRAKGGASDIVQETFVEAQRAFTQFSSSSQAEFLAWLRALLLNNLSDFRRRYRGTLKRASDREVELEGGGSSVDWRSNLAAAIPTPSGEYAHQESLDQLELAMSKLPEDYRVVLELRYVQDLPFEKIGESMGRSANAVQKLFARAVERLQSELESES